MPKQPTDSSTARRHRLYEFIESAGEVMVQRCATCVQHNRVCKVHIRSGKCSECVRRGQRCNVRVTESEFQRLLKEKEKLQSRIKETREAQDVAMKAHEKALGDLRTARAREERLRMQMDLLDRRTEEAIAVEERSIEDLEAKERAELGLVLPPVEPTDTIALSPSTWGAIADLPEGFWETFDFGGPVPPLLEEPLKGSGVVGPSASEKS
jgi:hypothetical protein